MPYFMEEDYCQNEKVYFQGCLKNKEREYHCGLPWSYRSVAWVRMRKSKLSI